MARHEVKFPNVKPEADVKANDDDAKGIASSMQKLYELNARLATINSGKALIAVGMQVKEVEKVLKRLEKETSGYEGYTGRGQIPFRGR